MHSSQLHLPSPLRRQWLLQTAALGTAAVLGGLPLTAQALPARQLQFPRDFGSHPDLRTEWWYITGLALAGGRRWGFQVTFFRSRVEGTQELRSAFAARQLIFAHAALTDLQAGRIAHDQRIARAGFGVAQASEVDTAIQLQNWSLVRKASVNGTGSTYTAQVQADDFSLALQFDTSQPVLLQGNNGLSRKGPQPEQASYYYSQPQMQVSGSLQRGSERFVVEPASAPGDNRAWLDHEASQALMHPEAVGWDWMGMNLHDGSALTVFRLRRADGSALWAGGSLRLPGQAARIFGATEVVFTPLRYWVSPLDATRYPVQWRVATPVGTFEANALLDNQELDSRASTGAVYWEGVCELRDVGDVGSALRGHGYLEMTGYAQTLRL